MLLPFLADTIMLLALYLFAKAYTYSLPTFLELSRSDLLPTNINNIFSGPTCWSYWIQF